jgi:phosphoglucomutase
VSSRRVIGFAVITFGVIGFAVIRSAVITTCCVIIFVSNKEEMTPLESAKEKARLWKTYDLDAETRAEIERMEREDEKLFVDSFYSDLEFGTGGLRGVMGVGSMRMNKYTVGMATQGLGNYILKHHAQMGGEGSVAIAYDSRNNASYFAQIAADILAENGIRVYLYSELRPTPLLSFTVRELNCTAGIVITASHNPKEYNGYKVYWSDGGQILPPNDGGIIQAVRGVMAGALQGQNAMQGAEQGRSEGASQDLPQDLSKNLQNELPSDLVHEVPLYVEEKYLELVRGLTLSEEAVKSESDISIVYTSIHGSGITLVPKTLAALGFSNVSVVEEQAVPDGNFPTVESPNPEEKSAMKMALELGEKVNAELVLGTDPDTDRVGLAVRNDQNELVLINGNQAGSLLVYYRLLVGKEKGKLPEHPFIGKTIVTTELIARIAQSFDVPCYDTLTGFKFIAGLIKEKEGKENFVAGGEESYGYLVSDFVRDKDAALSAVQFAEIAAYAKSKGTTMWGMLKDLYLQHGVFQEELVSITLKGIDGVAQIQSMMSRLRNQPPQTLGGVALAELHDVKAGTCKNMITGESTTLPYPSSDVLQFILTDGSKISARPSGTEPKIKFYFSLRKEISSSEEISSVQNELMKKIEIIKAELLN